MSAEVDDLGVGGGGEGGAGVGDFYGGAGCRGGGDLDVDDRGEFFGAIRPATSMVEISKLISPEMLVEIEADAIVEG